MLLERVAYLFIEENNGALIDRDARRSGYYCYIMLRSKVRWRHRNERRWKGCMQYTDTEAKAGVRT